MMFEQLTELSAQLASAAKMHITIETAGTLIPSRGVMCDLMSISPKLANSTPRNDARDPLGVWTTRHEDRRLDTAVLQQLLDREGDRQLKFVVRHETLSEDVVEIDGLLNQLTGWKPDDVLLMPEGLTSPTDEHRTGVIGFCLDRGWRYAHRLHIELFGNKRGT